MAVKGYHHFRRMAAAYWVLLLGLLATLVVYQRVADGVTSRERLRFQTESDSALVALRSRVNHYISALQSLQGFFHADDSVTPDKWKRYIPSLVWHLEYPNMLELGYVERIESDQLPEYVSGKHTAGWPTLEIRPAGARDRYYPILFLDSRLSESRHAIGIDLGTEPEQLEAMQRACERSAPASSGVVNLRAGAEFRPGHLIYVPVYRGGKEPREVKERHADLRGFVFASFNAADLYRDTLRQETNQVLNVEISDITPPSGTGAEDRRGDRTTVQGSVLTRTINLPGMGRWWQVRLSTLPAFRVNSARSVPPIVLGSGLALSLLFFGIAWVQAKGRIRAEELNSELGKYSEETRQTADALRHSEERWQLALRGSNDGIWDWDLRTNECFFSPRWREMFGFGTVAAPKRIGAWQERVHPEDRPRVERAFQDHCAKKTPFYVTEHRVRCQDGHYKWVLERGQALWDETGGAVRMAGSVSDISERKQAEEELRRSQQLLSSITQNISDGIYRSTPDKGLVYVNDAFVKLFGYGSVEEMLSVPTTRLYAQPERRQELITLLDRYGKFVNQEVEFVRQDGTRFWALTNGIGIREEATQCIAYYDGAISDITERKLAENKARQSEAVTRTINYFASSLFEQNTEEEILWDLAKNCVSQLGFVDCVVYLADRERRVLIQKAAFGPKNPEGRTIHNPITLHVGQGIVGAVAASGRPEVIGDTSQDPRYIVDDERRCSELAVPINASGEVIGVIDSEHPAKDFFTADHLVILTSIASLCANKLVRAWAEEELRTLNVDLGRRVRERTAELEAANQELKAEIEERGRAETLRQAIYQISEAVHTARDLSSLYRQIHEIIRRLMSANNLYIAAYDSENDLLSFPYYVDEADPTPPTRRLGKGFTEYVLQTGKPLLANRETIAELTRQGAYEPIGSPAAIWLGVPLSLHGRTFGVLAIQEYRDANAFGEDEKRMLTFVAEQIATAIDRKRAEAELRASAERLRQSEERFSKAFLASPAMVSLARLADGVFVEVNDTFQQLTGYLEPEVIGNTSFDLNLWAEHSARGEFLQQLKARGSVRDWEARLRSRQGRLYTVLLSAELIEIDNEPHILAVGIDITARKYAESELHKALAKEKELSELKSNFVSLVSHEFRTPLGIILSSSEVLERYLERLEPEQRLEHLQAIRKSVRRMVGLMEEVLVLGKVEAGQMEFKPAPIDLAAFCSRLSDEVLSATHHRCPIHFRAEPLPPGASGDENLLRHIFTNLLANAVKYSPPGCPVEFLVGDVAGQAVFRVKDQGVGIPATDQEQLFKAFHRGRNVGHLPGTGLGLSIVKRCVELHQGKIQVESGEGLGTTFTVRLPLFGDREAVRSTVTDETAFAGRAGVKARPEAPVAIRDAHLPT